MRVQAACHRAAHVGGEEFDELLHHLAHNLFRCGQHLLVHEVLRREHRLQQGLGWLDALEHLRVGHQLAQPIALQRVGLDAFLHRPREQLADFVDPGGHRELRRPVAAQETHGLPVVEEIQRRRAAGVDPQQLPQLLGSVPQDEPPTDGACVAHQASSPKKPRTWPSSACSKLATAITSSEEPSNRRSTSWPCSPSS